MVHDTLHSEAPSRSNRFAQQVLKSTLPLQVSWIGTDGQQTGNTTLGGREVTIPECQLWLVQPREDLSDKQWEALIRVIDERQIPGLKSGGNMSDKHLAMLGELEHLSYLDLSGWHTGITDEGLKHLAKLPNLQYLDLDLNSAHNRKELSPAQVTDKGLEVLQHLRNLIVLNLEDLFYVTDASIAHLTNHQHLERVSLARTMTGDGALKALRGNPNLVELSLGVQVTDAGLAHLKDYPAFANENRRRQSSIYSQSDEIQLSLAPCPGIGDAGLTHLAGLDGVHILSLTESRLLTLNWASHMPIRIPEAVSYTERGVAVARQMGSLREIGVSGEVLTDAMMQEIAQIPKLKRFGCGQSVAGDAGFAALSKSQTLERLAAFSCHNLTKTGVATLAALPNLKFLYLGGEQIDDDSVSSLPQFTALREFWTGNDNRFTDEAFKYLAAPPNLERLLNMYVVNTGDRATEHIAAKAKNLKWYGLMGTHHHGSKGSLATDRTLELLGGMETLEELIFDNLAQITDAGLGYLAKLPNLKKVEISGCKRITGEGIRVFGNEVQIVF